jgi:hypothetical protein
VDSLVPERDIPEWLRTIWHHHLAPSIELALQDTLNFRNYQELDKSKEIARMVCGCLVYVAIVLPPQGGGVLRGQDEKKREQEGVIERGRGSRGEREPLSLSPTSLPPSPHLVVENTHQCPSPFCQC